MVRIRNHIVNELKCALISASRIFAHVALAFRIFWETIKVFCLGMKPLEPYINQAETRLFPSSRHS